VRSSRMRAAARKVGRQAGYSRRPAPASAGSPKHQPCRAAGRRPSEGSPAPLRCAWPGGSEALHERSDLRAESIAYEPLRDLHTAYEPLNSQSGAAAAVRSLRSGRQAWRRPAPKVGCPILGRRGVGLEGAAAPEQSERGSVLWTDAREQQRGCGVGHKDPRTAGAAAAQGGTVGTLGPTSPAHSRPAHSRPA
jgi:hypothetical protein